MDVADVVGMVLEHLVASARGVDVDLVAAGYAGPLWEALRRNIPGAYSCVLMPDHLHLTAPPGQHRRFSHTLRRFSATFGVRFDVLAPEPANSPAIAGRMIRYGVFNPVRAGLVSDPHEWLWSTLRDLVGAAASCWTPLDRVSSALRTAPHRALIGLTTTADHRPSPLRRERPAAISIDAAISATASALRVEDEEVLRLRAGRRIAVKLLFELGCPRTDDVAMRLGLGVSTIRRLRASTDDAGVDAALACIADARLLRRQVL